MTALDLVGHLLPPTEGHKDWCKKLSFKGRVCKNRECDCGAEFINSTLFLVREALKKEVVVDEEKLCHEINMFVKHMIVSGGFFDVTTQEKLSNKLASCPEKWLKVKEEK